MQTCSWNTWIVLVKSSLNTKLKGDHILIILKVRLGIHTHCCIQENSKHKSQTMFKKIKKSKVKHKQLVSFLPIHNSMQFLNNDVHYSDGRCWQVVIIVGIIQTIVHTLFYSIITLKMHGVADIMLRHTRRESNEHFPDTESFKLALITKPRISLGGEACIFSMPCDVVTMC